MCCSANSLRCGLVAFILIASHSIKASTLVADDLFPDKGLEAAVRKEVFDKRYNTEPLTADDVKNISQVIGKGKGIKSLEGLQNCKALMTLDLERNEIADLGPIKDLKQLQLIDLASNKIEKIDAFAGLVQAQYLQLSKNAISDLTPLRDMANLRSLYIANNQIKTVEPVSGLKKMWTLDLAGNPLEDTLPIGKLKGLDTINLKGCGVKSLEFVRTLAPNLLMLNGNPNADLMPLVETCEADIKAEGRFAPFLKLYLDDSQLKEPSQASAIERLKAARVKINPK